MGANRDQIPDRCVSALVPQAAIDAAVLAGSKPVHDDGHTDCFYAGILLAAWPHLNVVADQNPALRGSRVVAVEDVYVTDTFIRLTHGSWGGSAALGPSEPMMVERTSRDERGDVVLEFDRYTKRTFRPGREVIIAERRRG